MAVCHEFILSHLTSGASKRDTIKLLDSASYILEQKKVSSTNSGTRLDILKSQLAKRKLSLAIHGQKAEKRQKLSTNTPVAKHSRPEV